MDHVIMSVLRIGYDDQRPEQTADHPGHLIDEITHLGNGTQGSRFDNPPVPVDDDVVYPVKGRIADILDEIPYGHGEKCRENGPGRSRKFDRHALRPVVSEKMDAVDKDECLDDETRDTDILHIHFHQHKEQDDERKFEEPPDDLDHIHEIEPVRGIERDIDQARDHREKEG